jgi:hypothetical protein
LTDVNVHGWIIIKLKLNRVWETTWIHLAHDMAMKLTW